MKKIEFYLRWLSIVLFTILAIMATIPTLAMIRNAGLRAKGIYLSPYHFQSPFGLLLFISILFWFVVIRFLFQDFYARGQLSGRVRQFHETFLANPFRRIYSFLSIRARLLAFRMLISGIGILLFLSLLAVLGSLDESAYYLVLPSFRNLYPYVPDKSPVMFLNLRTPDNNVERYLETTLKIARELQRAGTRVMIIELPPLHADDRTVQLVSELNNTGIVVFGIHYHLFNHNTRLSEQPLFDRLSLSWGQFTSSLSQVYEFNPSRYRYAFGKFVPYGTSDARTGKIVPDVVVEALRKYEGAREIRADRNAVLVGEKRIPTSSDGTTFVNMSGGLYYPSLFTIELTLDGKRPQYLLYHKTMKAVPRVGSLLEGIESDFKDRIVLTSWFDGVGAYREQQSWIEMSQYSVYMDCVARGRNLVTRVDLWPVILTLITVLLCGLLARYFRGLVSVPSMIFLGVTLVVIARWLLHDHDLLLEVSYPLASVILSIAIFPLVRFSYMMRAMTESADWDTGFFPAAAPQIAPHSSSEKTVTRQEKPAKHLSLSFPLAFAIVLLLVVSSAGITYWSLHSTEKPKPEVVYLMSMPPVEVVAYYSN